MKRYHSRIRVFAILLIVFQSLLATGQENIATNRPGMYIDPWVLPQHSVQWESGYGLYDGPQSWNFDTFFRMSMSKSTEIRIRVPNIEQNLASVGLKWMAIKPEGNKPGVGFSFDMSTDGGNLIVTDFRLAVNKQLSDRFTGFFNTGMSGSGFFGDAGVVYAMGDKFSITADYWYHEDWMQVTSYVAYLINSETQVDIGGAWLDQQGAGYYFTVGFSRRFKTRYSRDESE